MQVETIEDPQRYRALQVRLAEIERAYRAARDPFIRRIADIQGLRMPVILINPTLGRADFNYSLSDGAQESIDLLNAVLSKLQADWERDAREALRLFGYLPAPGTVIEVPS
jgi:hypothetical protein